MSDTVDDKYCLIMWIDHAWCLPLCMKKVVSDSVDDEWCLIMCYYESLGFIKTEEPHAAPSDAHG